MHVFLFNGPPGSGKDTSAEFLIKELQDLKYKTFFYKLAIPVKCGTHALYGYPELSHDYFEHSKEIPNDIFFGLTPRQAYIEFSEKLVKPTKGNDFFGKIGANICKQHIDNNVIVITDFGFKEEFDVVKEYVGVDKLIVLNVYRDGKTFANDSRSYLTNEIIDARMFIRIDNNSDLFDLKRTMKSIAEKYDDVN